MRAKTKWLILLSIVMLSCLITSGFFFLKSGLISFDDGDINEAKIQELREFSAKIINIFLEGKELKSLIIQTSENQSLEGIDLIEIYSSNINLKVTEANISHFELNGYYLGRENERNPELVIEKVEDVLSVKTIIPKCWLVREIGGSNLSLDVSLPKEYNGSLIIYNDKDFKDNEFGLLKFDVKYYPICNLD